MAEFAIGLRAQKGGAVAVVVTAGDDGPRLIASTFLEFTAPDDVLALGPYAAATAMIRDGASREDAARAAAEGRRRQDQGAAKELRRIGDGLDGPITAALLVNRAGWINDLLAYSLEWAEHVPVAEGLAVRDALRAGSRDCGYTLIECDEKSLPAVAETALDLPPAEIDSRLKAMGAVAGKPWRREQKLAGLAGWMALPPRVR